MRTVSMSGFLRGNVGKKDAKKIRRDGSVPCVVYGGKEQMHFFTDTKNFQKIVFTPEVCFVKLTIEGKEMDVILKDIQYHPVTDNIMHADFMELKADKPIVMNIPVKIFGTAPGVLKGGKVVQKYRKLKVKALPGNMPEVIDINIGSLEIGQNIKIADIPAENYSLLDNKNNTIVGVVVTRAVEEAATAAPTAEAGAPAAGAAAPAAGAAAPAADAKAKAKK
ncbi:MAG TPA: 50S ribosomal protein L25/general stress protein Ctc [Bacteroidales bacterium]|nr:50S ribosomal protein L25/general stress protein Ctc [Bacteroidales bacterium]